MGRDGKMNVLVLGNSGAGKSTLIKAISGIEVQTGVGEGNTQKIDVYESSTWPIRCIDTKGFEYSKLEQFKTIWQVKKFTREQVALSQKDQDGGVGIDAVWYCIEGTARRTFSYNIEMMNRAVRKWKNIPVFVVITKSYSEADIEENIQAVRSAFAKNNHINLQAIIPVVAEAYQINDETVVTPRGIEVLCSATLDRSEMAISISEENKNRMILEQKRFTANALVTGATAAAIVVGAAPVPFADSLILVPLETGLTKGILKVYGVEFTGELITSIVGSTAITNVARAALSALKTIPNIAGSVLNAVVAGFFVAALGEAVIALSEALYTGKIDREKISSAVDFVSDKLSSNPALSAGVKYLESHSDKLQGQSAKEIFGSVQKALTEAAKSLKK
jgi:uncharacterized protein (DUF697 family)/GTP-binding protein EngB required for normal cell division